jgi:hypothetical protein
VFVQPADELRIETSVDAPVYKPGGEAHIGFRVTNNRGEGVQAALGLEVVDQAVFALAEKQPGFAKVFFYLEQELMKPRYEIHSIGLPEAISAVIPGQEAQRDRAAQALFSAMEVTQTNNASMDFGREAPQTKFAAYMDRYQSRMIAQVEQRVDALYGADDNSDACRQELPADLSLFDPWGHRLQVQRPYPGLIFVRSAGPDGQLYNNDDRVMDIPNPWCSARGSMRIRRGRSAADGSVQVSGTVRDRAGAVIPRSEVTLANSANGTKFTATTDAQGRFSLTGLHEGHYTIESAALGFSKAVQRFPLRDGERAVIEVTLDVGAAAETVTVTAGAALFKAETVMVMNGVARAPMAAMAANFRATGVDSIQPVPAQETHVRLWFPESLYVAPEIITDRDGRASITVPIADNITTWRMAMLASTRQGDLGSGTSSLKVFQDFFTEMDLPVVLTQGDEVTIPVAIYNYAGSRGNVRLRLEEGDWFAADGDSLQ